jgi:hypothetical protein
MAAADMTGPSPSRTVLAGSAPRSPAPAVRALLLAATGPALWFVHLNASYLLVPPSCRWGHRWAFVGITVVALAGIALGALASWRLWRAVPRGDSSGLVPFLGLTGVLLAALFALTTVLVGASPLLVDPCR